jgi:hypothetical protein
MSLLYLMHKESIKSYMIGIVLRNRSLNHHATNELQWCFIKCYPLVALTTNDASSVYMEKLLL